MKRKIEYCKKCEFVFYGLGNIIGEVPKEFIFCHKVPIVLKGVSFIPCEVPMDCPYYLEHLVEK